jgi:DNA-binding PadR family transcriptional regulator
MVPGMATRSRSNPLALAVLTCLFERPMHPYEMAQTLRTRAKHESIKLNYGSLYGVVETLEGRRLIEAVETSQQGRRPQRTVYAITEAGKTEMTEWLAELLAVPVKEYLRYEAALSLIGALPPDEALPLLRQRCDALEIRIDQLEAGHEAAAKRGLPRLFEIEGEYVVALARAELAFTRELADEIEEGTIPGLDVWRSFYGPDAASAPSAATPDPPDEGDA